MAIPQSDIKVGAVYETAGQLRKVVRLMQPYVIYEVRAPGPPYYRVSVS